MKKTIEKGTIVTPNKKEATYIITMNKENMCIEAKNEKKLHIYSYVNQDIYFFYSRATFNVFRWCIFF
jgi:hypothetical protein